MIEHVRTVSAAALRRLVVHAQGYVSPVAARARRTMSRPRCVPSRASSSTPSPTVERSHRIALATRVGLYPRDTVSRLLRGGRLFEYWAHEACLLPAEDWPLFRTAMDGGGRPWWTYVERTHAHLREEILDRIRQRGPARLARLRRRAGQGHVGAQAGQGDARPPLEPRRARDRRPHELPAPLRPARARAAASRARRADADRGGAPAHAGAARRCGRAAR